ncbi:IscS subfamily cysteine desulfurase [Candidatus Parcubacteria bacterium]|nr:IscS subfamily cysteine desulfurase [Candidatus Parcubacteria bacterium]
MIIYLDNAATTPCDKTVLNEMLPYFCEKFGNPNSLHSFGQEAKQGISKARKMSAAFLNCDCKEVFFTSGATESNNWALKGVAQALKKRGNHIITTEIEHPCILATAEYLAKQGFKITYIKPQKNGIIKISDVEKAITEKTILISVMYANNEIGTIQPIGGIGRMIRMIRSKNRRIFPFFHTDAAQAVNYLDCDVEKLGVDMLSLSGHKIYGPKGIGALYIRKGTPIAPFMHGGHQEKGMRSGTLNVPAIVGLGKAIELVGKYQLKNSEIEQLRDYLIDNILKKIPAAKLNGDRKKRLQNNVNFSFEKAEGESVLMSLEVKGIAVSTGSACASGDLSPSHVLLAIGLPHISAHGSLRITLGRQTTKQKIDYLLKVLPPIVEKIRKIARGIKIN